MILYVNGDSHTAGAEIVTPYAFAEDDQRYIYMGRRPHPANIVATWGRTLADALKANFWCDAESASSNARIIRTTKRYLADHAANLHETLMIIQWSTWEREEWLHNDVYYQVNASGIDDVPKELQTQYKEFVAGVDWLKKTHQAHNELWQFHQELNDLKVRHVFFNGNTDFSKIQNRQDWGVSYLNPYQPKSTFSDILKEKGYATVAPNSYHFGKTAHSFWSNYMLQYVISNHLI